MATQAPTETPAAGETPAAEENRTGETTAGDGVANLPLSRGRSFRCLDDYLAHLEQGGAIDLPWWRQIRPGVYERQVRMTGAEREIATREQLMERFGFRC